MLIVNVQLFQKPFSKKSKSPKQTRKKNFAEDTNLDVIPTIDNDLLKVLENQDGEIELSEEALNQFAPVENFRDPDLAVLPEEKSPKKTGTCSQRVEKLFEREGKGSEEKERIEERKG